MFHKGKCQVCGKETEVAECESVFGTEIKFWYCEDCMIAGAEPYHDLVTYICGLDCDEDNLTDDFKEIVGASVEAAGKNASQFWKDVEREKAQELQLS